MERTSESFFAQRRFKIHSDGDMITDARHWTGCGVKDWNPHISV